MRLFLAIGFPLEVKTVLLETIEKLKRCAYGGNFTRPENLHQTLIFLGEVSQGKLSLIQGIMDQYAPAKTETVLEGLGKFPRKDKAIYWVGVQENPVISRYHSDLTTAFRGAGFSIENRPYRPHITLGREIQLRQTPDFTFEKQWVPVQAINLMKSERINGRLTYTSVYETKLKQS